MHLWQLEQQVTAADGFTWWRIIKVFPTRKAAELYQRLYYKNSAAVTRIVKG